MVPYRDYILFAKKGGNQLFSFNTQSHDFKQIRSDLSITALCCSNNYVYILSQKNQDYIKILDFQFQTSGNIPSLIEKGKNCNFDMCMFPAMQTSLQSKLRAHALVICKSTPVGYVRKLDRSDGKVWQIDSKSHPQLTQKFCPCSVTASTSGSIFVADRAMHKVHF